MNLSCTPPAVDADLDMSPLDDIAPTPAARGMVSAPTAPMSAIASAAAPAIAATPMHAASRPRVSRTTLKASLRLALHRVRAHAPGPRTRGWTAIAATLVLAGCASTPPLPTPFHTPTLRLPTQAVVTSLDPAHAHEEITVSVAQDGQAQLWTARDARGQLVTQEHLVSGQWQPVAGAPVATRYTRLFAAMLLAWTPRSELEFVYGPNTVRRVTAPNGDTRRSLVDCNGNLVMRASRQIAHPGQERLDLTDPVESWMIGPISDAITTPITGP